MNTQFHRIIKPERDHDSISRRMFLKASAMAGITTATMLGGTGPAFSEVLKGGQAETLLRMVQDIYPHPDLIDIAHYQTIADTVKANAIKDSDMAAGLQDGLTNIEKQAQALFGSSYAKIKDSGAREGILRKFQNEEFFQGVRWTAYFSIYNNKDIWPLFGYEGSSVEHGGYINRGFSDITFVPQGPTLEERMNELRD